MSRVLTIEDLAERLDRLATEFAEVAERYRALTPDAVAEDPSLLAMTGDEWVSVDGIATDLADLARDVRSDLLPHVRAA